MPPLYRLQKKGVLQRVILGSGYSADQKSSSGVHCTVHCTSVCGIELHNCMSFNLQTSTFVNVVHLLLHDSHATYMQLVMMEGPRCVMVPDSCFVKHAWCVS